MESFLHLQNGKFFASSLLQNNAWQLSACVGVSEVCPHEPGVRAAAELVLGPEASVPHPHSAILASADDPPAVVALDKAGHLTGVAS